MALQIVEQSKLAVPESAGNSAFCPENPDDGQTVLAAESGAVSAHDASEHSSGLSEKVLDQELEQVRLFEMDVVSAAGTYRE
jgi:hypothetical protein